MENAANRYLLGNVDTLGTVSNENYHCPVDGQGLFAYAVFSVTEKCDIDHEEVKIELRMWEGKATSITGGSLDDIKSEIISDENLITTRVSPVSVQFNAPVRWKNLL